MKNNNSRDTRRAATVKDTAEILGLSTSLVQKVTAAKRDNNEVIEVMMILDERKKALVEELKMIYHPAYSSITRFSESA
jgi:predicted transcriptional regulator